MSRQLRTHVMRNAAANFEAGALLLRQEGRHRQATWAARAAADIYGEVARIYKTRALCFGAFLAGMWVSDLVWLVTK